MKEIQKAYRSSYWTGEVETATVIRMPWGYTSLTGWSQQRQFKAFPSPDQIGLDKLKPDRMLVDVPVADLHSKKRDGSLRAPSQITGRTKRVGVIEFHPDLFPLEIRY